MQRRGLWTGVTVALLGASMPLACGRAASDSRGDDPASCDQDADCVEGQECTAGACVFANVPPGADGGEADVGGQSGQGDPAAGGAAGGGQPSGGEPETACQPGERSCDGPSARLCDSAGSWLIDETCERSEVCSDGVCKAIVCAPGASSCRDGEVHACGPDGTSTTRVETCDEERFCREQDGAAECSDVACLPGAALCVDDTATKCKADGSGPEPGGTNCSLKSQVCWQGRCSAASCTPGEKLCKDGDVYLCIGGGVNAVSFSECANDEICDPALAACLPRICEPGKRSCDGVRIVTCNALGTGFGSPDADCASSNQLCVDGSCRTQVCIPSSTFCDGNNIAQCDTQGLASSPYQSCPASYYHCVSNYYGTNNAACVSNTCTPGAAVCNNNLATTCNADGTGYSAGGVDCGSSSVCQGGSCVPKVCEGYGYFCKGEDVAYCQGGLNYFVSQLCGLDAHCVSAAGQGSPSCVPYSCSPGLKACIGNQVGTCGADGTTLGSVKEDCSLAGKVCTSSSACGDSAVDSLGAAEELQSLAAGGFFGDVIDVKSNRELTQLEANLVLATARDLRYVVYEQVSGNYVARYDKIVATPAGSGYVSSGVISYTLKAGRRYVLGVAVSPAGGFAPYYDAAPFSPDVSFGKAVGSLSASYAATLYDYTSADRAYDLRFTTSLP